MFKFVVAYLGAGLTMLVLDAIWLTTMMPFYRQNIGHLLAGNINLPAAAAFYLLYVLGIVYFAVLPAAADGSWAQALKHGALLGLVCYGTYDLTNHATLTNWPVSITITDMAWGSFLTALAAAAGCAAVLFFAAV